MTRVVFHEAAIRHYFRSEEGPVGRYLARKAVSVEQKARAHAEGHQRSGDLLLHMRFVGMFENDRGLYAVVGTDATSPRQGYPYPVALETGINPWTGEDAGYRYPFLEPALEEEGFLPIVRR